MFALLQAGGDANAATNTVAEATNAVIDKANAVAAAPAAISETEAAQAADAAKAAAEQAHTSLWDMVADATLVSKIVLIILVACAVYALSLLFEKILVMRSVKSKTSAFVAAFRKAKTPDEAAQAVAKQPDSTAKRMFTAAMAEVQKTRDLGLYSMKSGDHTLARVQTVMDIEQNKGI